jgi:hypothetical protein
VSDINLNISSFANVATAYSSVGKFAVGEENIENKGEPIAPVVEPSASSASGDEQGFDNIRQEEERLERTKLQREQQQQDSVEQKEIAELAARDREVKAHEQAHAAAGGQYAGAPSYQYQRGPNGVSYAVGGEVAISAPTGTNSEQALQAAEQVRRAALAPAQPSSQDISVAAQASKTAANIRAEMSQQVSDARIEELERKAAVKSERLEEETEAQKQAEISANEVERQQARSEALSQERIDNFRQASGITNAVSRKVLDLSIYTDQKAVGTVLNQLV